MKNKKKLFTSVAIVIGVLVLLVGVFVAMRLSNVFRKAKVDDSWYSEDKTEFLITTADELRGFAKLSEKYDFKGKTVKLGADIILNDGDYTAWRKNFLKTAWTSIEGFAGTFDGQGHTISGLYCVGNGYSIAGKDLVYNPAGMFNNSTEDSIIRNFRIVNSYYSSTNKGGIGSVIGCGNGTVDSVYSDALIVTTQGVNGGIVGEAKEGGSLTITNCWFDGEIQMLGESAIYTGGILGYLKSTSGKTTIEHCLFTGKITNEKTSGTLDTGGMVGVTIAKSRLEMNDCLFAGELEVAYRRNAGTIIGSHEGTILKANHVYADLGSYTATIGFARGEVSGYPLELNSDCLVGDNAAKWTELDFKKYWTIVEDGTPILQTFAENKVSVGNVEKAYDTSWYNELDDTYTISTLDQLYGFYVLSSTNKFKDKTLKLGADIKINEGTIADWQKQAPSIPFYPIKEFGGTFDGQGHTISGIYLSTSQRNSGLFSKTTSTALVKNFRLTNSYFESTADGIGLIGSVVGFADGKIDTVYSEAVVVTDALIAGGIAGNISAKERATISNCWFAGQILVGDNGGYIGGIVGQVEDSSHAKIMHSLNSGSITATKEKGSMTMGGILGVISDDRTNVTISDTLNVGSVTTPSNGGIGAIVSTVLQKTFLTLEDCYATSESCVNAYAGIHGELTGACYQKLAADLSGYKGYEWTFLDFDKYWAVVKNGTPILQAFADNIPSTAGYKRKINIDWYKDNQKTYVLKTSAELYGLYHMSYLTDFEGKTVRLGKDIIVNNGNAADWQNNAPTNPWYPIKNFAGTFDGKGHTISGVYLKSDVKGTGLFSDTTDKAVLKNFKLENSYFESTQTGVAVLGSVVGKAKGKIDTVYCNSIVVCDSLVCGGIVGTVVGDATITNCWYDGQMKIGSKGGYIGGIAGQVEDGVNAKIMHCLNSGTIAGAKEEGIITLGGIVGVVADDGTNLTISDTLNVGVVSNPSGRGIGSILSTTLQKTTVNLDNCYATYESCAVACPSPHGTLNGACYQKSEADLSGYKGYQFTLLNFADYWAVSESGTPVLKSFANSIPSLEGYARKINIDWYNPKESVYVLNTTEDLYGFYHMSFSTDFKDKTVKLGKDITVNNGNATDWQNNAPENPWYPIKNFAGTFDGQGHSINGIYLKTNVKSSGFFDITSKTSTLKNFKLKNSYFEFAPTGIAVLGSVVGNAKGNIDTVYSDAIVVTDSLVCGGIAGTVTGEISITNCWYDGEMRIGANGGYAGGITGQVEDGVTANISHCLNSGSLSGAKEEGIITLGGIVGVVADDGTNLTISDTLNVGVVSNPSGRGIGSILSTTLQKTTVNLDNCYATYESSAVACPSPHGTLNGACYQKSEADLSGYKGYQFTLLNFADYWAVSKASTPILQSFADSKPSLAGYDRMIDISWYNPSKSTYTLKSAEDLYGFYHMSFITDFSGKTVKLKEDITVNDGKASNWQENAPENPWYPIKSFAGTFDGQGHSINGIYLKTNVKGSGLFDTTADTAILRNFKLKNSYIESTCTGVGVLGSVVGNAKGQMDTIYSDAIVVSNSLVCGGLAGTVTGNVDITNCWFDGEMQINNNGGYVGGIAGQVEDGMTVKISHSLNSGTIFGTNPNSSMTIAGICGVIADKGTELTISDTLNVGKVSCPTVSAAGAIVSTVLQDTTLKLVDCYATYDSCASAVYKVHGVSEGLCSQKTEDSIIGYKGYQWTLLDFKNYWAVVEKGTPILQSFAETIPSLDGVEKMISFDWYNEEDDTYVLNSCADFYGFASLVNEGNSFEGKTVKLGNDIKIQDGDATTWASSAPEVTWTPIGTATQNSSYKDDLVHPFNGTFDGQGHTISGVYIKQENSMYQGLFGATGENAIVQNFRLMNSYIKGSHASGAVAGAGNGTFRDIYSDAIVEGNNASGIGGIVGRTYNGGIVMENCWNAGRVSTTRGGNNPHTGGLVGLVGVASSFTNCLNTGSISATNNANATTGLGGLVGIAAANVTITDCLNTGSILKHTNTTSGYGGLVGNVSGGTVKLYTSYADASICDKAVGTSAGVELYDASNNKVDAANVETTIRIQKAAMTGANATNSLVGFDFTDKWAVVSGSTPVLKSFEDISLDISWYDESKSEFTLYDKGDLFGFASLVNEGKSFVGKTVKLGNDIKIQDGDATTWATSAPGVTWTPIGTARQNNRWTDDLVHPFNGTFDGQGHTISGVYINQSGTMYQGLFGATGADAILQDFRLVNSYIRCSHASGAIAGTGNGTFKNIYSNAIVDANNASGVGGIVGRTYNGGVAMENCWNAGTVSTTRGGNNPHTGGLVGLVGVASSFANCLNTGSISATSNGNTTTGLGGLVGIAAANVTMTDCLNAGSIRKHANNTSGYGGLVGNISAGTTKIYTSYTDASSCDKAVGTTGVELYDAANNKVDAANIEATIRIQKTAIAGAGAINSLVGFDFDNKWVVVLGNSPVLKSFEDVLGEQLLDIGWYDDSLTEFVLYDKADLFGFASLVNTGVTFNGKTVKLGNDIKIQDGDATTWVTSAPKLTWTPIGTATQNRWYTDDLVHPFNGTFDGQGHTISGVYIKKDSTMYQGLFGATGADAILQNFRLENSYIRCSHASGAIAGAGNGRFKNIYSNAIVDANNASGVGGIVGRTYNGGVVMENCWNAGPVSTTRGGNNPHIGGLVGLVGVASSFTNCLNTGSISATSNGNATTGLGGLVGIAAANVTMTDCLNAGSIKKHANNTSGYGGLVGNISTGTTQIYTSYTDASCCDKAVGISSGLELYDSADIKVDACNMESTMLIPNASMLGENALESLKGFDFTNNWLVISDKIPVLKGF